MPTALHWFRRDLRIRDNTALYSASFNATVIAAFITDPRWFGNPQKMGPFQAHFYLESLRELSASLAARRIPLIIQSNPDPVAALLALARLYHVEIITYNKDYEPDQIAQDMRLERAAAALSPAIKILPHKDAVIFEEHELLTGSGSTYSVFTPYKKAWLKHVWGPQQTSLPRIPWCPIGLLPDPVPTAAVLGIPPISPRIRAGESAAGKLLQQFVRNDLQNYDTQRNFPANPHGTSHLSAHLNAGTLSIRSALAAALASDIRNKNIRADAKATFISQLIWRDFYKMILFNYPETVSQPFQKKTTHITWSNDPNRFAAWSSAQTGFPIVDAAMTQLNITGFMHNRLRMIAAMFLTKDLDTHWTLGERYFRRTLIDYDQAANVGGWQWSASTGTDAAPYFRIMNPTLQSQRFDPEGIFIRQQLPALKNVPTEFIHAPHLMPPEAQIAAHCIIGQDYPAPIVDHAQAKSRAIARFKK